MCGPTISMALCKCGCIEGEHDNVPAFAHPTDGSKPIMTYVRSRCHGYRFRVVRGEEPQVPIEGFIPEKERVETYECDCQRFDPAWVSGCHGFGF